MENENLNVKETSWQETLTSSLSSIRSRLTEEVRRRKAVITPVEKILSALKDPHHNAVTLYEATQLLAKVSKTLVSPEESEPLINQLNLIAREKLSDLQFSFARDLRLAFEEKGITLEGPPEKLVAGLFVIHVNMATRQVNMTFSHQPVTDKKVKLDVNRVVSAYQRAKREICERNTNIEELLKQIFETCQRVLKLGDKPPEERAPIVECYRELVLTKQSNAFRKAPSKGGFLDYPKTHFIYDMLVARQENRLTFENNKLNFGPSTIEVGADSSKALFLADSALNGHFIKDIYFTREN